MGMFNLFGQKDCPDVSGLQYLPPERRIEQLEAGLKYIARWAHRAIDQISDLEQRIAKIEDNP